MDRFSMNDRLAHILAVKREHVASARAALPYSELAERAAVASPPRGFRAALEHARADGRYGLIAEVKKASPSKGLIRADFDPPAIARAYRDGGAACLSVLTDAPFFQGEDSFLVAARNAVDIPVLRKDFMIDPWQVTEARGLGADCILLIVAALADGQLAELEAAAVEHGMDVLVEVHDAAEMERALRLHSRLIGVNNRDLRDFSVDTARTVALAPLVPAGTTLVAESGLSSPADLAALSSHGINAFLIGEALMRQADVAEATRTLLAR
jgi:indole-3-glycerol phosphate synthase